MPQSLNVLLPSKEVDAPELTNLARPPSSELALPIPLLALFAAVAYYFGSQVGFLLTPSNSPIALFWPPNAILLGILLLTSKRSWPLLLLAVLPAHLWIQLRTGIPLVSALGWFVGNTGEALIGAVSIRFFCKQRSLFESVEGVAIFAAFGIGFATLLTSFLDAASTVGSGLSSAFWKVWSARLASNTLADITIVPIVLSVGLSGQKLLRKMNLQTVLEAVALLTGLVTVSLIVFGGTNSGYSRSALIFVPVPFLIWAAMRFGAAGLSISLLLTSVISFWNVMHGRGPLQNAPMSEQSLALHALFTLTGLPLLVLAAMISERQRSEEVERNLRSLLIYASERERQRVARELHEDLAQQLSLVGSTVDELRATPNASTSSSWEAIHQQIANVAMATTRMSHTLHPYKVDYLGLVGALRELCNSFEERTGVGIEFAADKEIEVPLAASYALYFVAREAFDSMADSEKPSKVWLELKRTPPEVALRIAFEGTEESFGMPAHSALAYMREQMTLAPGTLIATRTANRFEIVATAKSS
jgi:integral membrane sensor domain MASE1